MLGLAGLIGAGVTAACGRLRARAGRLALAVPLVVGALLFLNLPALWTGGFYGGNLQRPEDIPRYWTDATRASTRGGDATRVLEVPGSDFASYRWGNTVDPITPGIIDRPYVACELIPYGSPASANLLNALDLRLQDRKLTPGAIAPLARLMSVGDVTLRNDIQFERYRLLRPLFTWDLFTPTPAGLSAARDLRAPDVVPEHPSTRSSTSRRCWPTRTSAAPAGRDLRGRNEPARIVRRRIRAAPRSSWRGDGDGVVDTVGGRTPGRVIRCSSTRSSYGEGRRGAAGGDRSGARRS